ncbi:MAG: alkaline phosphatase D family protein [Planctomycetota bacterium]|nr:alkaline phosphatase D family protein [Planctomycetota bacterium]
MRSSVALAAAGWFCLLLGCVGTGGAVPPSEFRSDWSAQAAGTWIGPDYWANRLQDWRVADGRLECVRARLPMRTAHLTSWRTERTEGGLVVSVRTGSRGQDAVAAGAFTGILIGAGAADLDPRAACLVQSAPGPDGGVLLGIDGAGGLFLADFTRANFRKATERAAVGTACLKDVVLQLTAEEVDAGWRLVGLAMEPGTGEVLGRVERTGVDPTALLGNLALVSHRGGNRERSMFWFEDWQATGEMLVWRPELRVGPILAALHTLSDGVLKMSAVMMPIAAGEVALEVQRGGRWSEVAVAPFAAPDYTACLRVEDWPSNERVPYRLRYAVPGAKAPRGSSYEGVVRPDPVDQPELSLAALSCVHQVRFGFGRAGYPWNDQALWFPHVETCEVLEFQDPDLLFFAGDQIYEGASPTPPDRGPDAGLDYLYKWYLWCWAFRDLARDRPVVTIPDDHDVFQGNLWGAGGRKARRDNEGGYVMPADWVRMVERTQTSHLPDPADPAPVGQGIGVYFTNLDYGGVSFAILEDRKFKSGPKGLVDHGGPRPDHITDPDLDMASVDVEGAELLGERQLQWLDRWARSWDGVEMKAVLSQTVFANVATHHGSRQDFLLADMDSNGWPQSGRNEALAAIRRAFAVMISGDQHLATVVHHGIDAHGDAGWSFCVPAVANFYLRSWSPKTAGKNRQPGQPEYTGDFSDGFGNLVTLAAASNVRGPSGRTPKELYDKNPGHGLIRFLKPEREVVFECWPRGLDSRTGEQFLGWPIRVQQLDNYARQPAAYLPPLTVEGVDDPVLVVEDSDGELVYALRLPSASWQPPVFAPGRYRVTVREGRGHPERAQTVWLEAGPKDAEAVEIRVP